MDEMQNTPARPDQLSPCLYHRIYDVCLHG